MLLLFSTFVFYPQHLFTFRERRKDWRTCDKKSLCNNVKKKENDITLFWCYRHHFIHTVVFVLYFSHISKLWYMLKAAFVLFCLLFAYYSTIGSVSRWSRGCDFRCQVWRDRCTNRVFLLSVTVSCHSQRVLWIRFEWVILDSVLLPCRPVVTPSLWLHPSSLVEEMHVCLRADVTVCVVGVIGFFGGQRRLSYTTLVYIKRDSLSSAKKM